MIHYVTSDGIGQPWVGNELRIVQKAGVPFVLHAMRRAGKVHFTSDWAVRLHRETRVIYPLPIVESALSVLFAPFLFRSLWWSALRSALFGARENLRARFSVCAHFVVACVLARRLRNGPVSHFHAQWAYSSATIAMFSAWLLKKPFSFTGHAADLFRDRVALQDKIRRAEFIVCISEFHREFFLSEGARPEQLVLVYCGIDISRMKPSVRNERRDRYTIISAGRLVEKKGFDVLIDACRQLVERGRQFHCIIAGSGPLESELRHRVREFDLDRYVTITGQPVSQEEIPDLMGAGDVFVLACVRAVDGDVDGLPQSTMEAMACGLPAITTRLVGNPDLVVHESTGLLVEPGKVVELADAMDRLMEDPELAAVLAGAGRRWIQERFNIENCLDPLIQRYRVVCCQNDRSRDKVLQMSTA